MLDFRRVNHQLTDDQSRWILSELKKFWDDSGKKGAGEMMNRALEVFREAGQRCFQEDLKRSKLKEVEYIQKLEVSFCLNKKVVFSLVVASRIKKKYHFFLFPVILSHTKVHVHRAK